MPAQGPVRHGNLSRRTNARNQAQTLGLRRIAAQECHDSTGKSRPLQFIIARFAGARICANVIIESEQVRRVEQSWARYERFLLLLGDTRDCCASRSGAAQLRSVACRRPGETLGHIAQQYGVNLYQLAALNDIGNAHLIYTWQRLTLPADAAHSDRRLCRPNAATHTVRLGETLGSIAEIVRHQPFRAATRPTTSTTPGSSPATFLCCPAKMLIPTPQSQTKTRRRRNLLTPTQACKRRHAHRPPGRDLWLCYRRALRRRASVRTCRRSTTTTTAGFTSAKNCCCRRTEGDSASRRSATRCTERGHCDAHVGQSSHVVQFGDTLGTIAVSYGVSLVDLQALNDTLGVHDLPGPGAGDSRRRHAA